jgi:hypothetical protein
MFMATDLFLTFVYIDIEKASVGTLAHIVHICEYSAMSSSEYDATEADSHFAFWVVGWGGGTDFSCR